MRISHCGQIRRVDKGDFPHSSAGKESTCNSGDLGSIPGLGRSPGRRKWQPTLLFLPGKSHGQRSLLAYSPWGHNLATEAPDEGEGKRGERAEGKGIPFSGPSQRGIIVCFEMGIPCCRVRRGTRLRAGGLWGSSRLVLGLGNRRA